MAFLSRSRLFGVLLILASLPMDPGTALATGMVSAAGEGPAPATPAAEAMEARLRRISEAVRQQQDQTSQEGGVSDADDLAYVYVGPGGFGWGNGGFYNGGFRNGGWGNGGFWNGGFRNGGFRNGGWGNGGGWRNGGFRNGGFRNHW